ncbi:MAG: hypothetical protein GY828_01785 [Candidatus Gracilibacteria bacterium]|nr:hypothetical protein [Candidatus Gracilibacteria bacterium]
MKKLLFILLSTVILFSCDPIETDKSQPPKSEFINSFKKRGINLSNYLKDPEFLVKTSTGDTIQYEVKFIKDGRKNIIKASGKTIFYGKIIRSRELFFLHEEISNSHYFVSVIQIEDSIRFYFIFITPRKIKSYRVKRKGISNKFRALSN